MNLPFKYRLTIDLLRSIASTWRIRTSGKLPEPPAIIAFWHGLMMPCWKYFAGKNSYAVVSQSKDGEILTQLLKKWNYEVLRGSSSKGSKDVLSKMEKAAERGYLLITPDGPRGKIYEFKPGAVITAYRKKVPLYLCGVRMKSFKSFDKSWDKFKLPLPFSRIDLHFSDPVVLPETAVREEITDHINRSEKILKDLSGVG